MADEDTIVAGKAHDLSAGDPFATQSEAAYVFIREDILSGRLKPAQKLRLEALRAQYGYGASPLREALSRLAAERLVTARGQRGYWVAAISAAEYADIVDMRLQLEPMALARSIANASPDWEARLTLAYRQLCAVEGILDTDPEGLSGDWERENRAFHRALIGNCGSDWLLRFVAVLSEQSERYRRQALALQAVPKETLLREHREIYEAAMARKAGLAVELLKLHIRQSADGLGRTLFGPPAD